MTVERLPILTIIPQLTHTLCEHSIVLLTAEPGAGKTTQVPLALLKEPWLRTKKIIVLEPRRLAARAAAHRMASLLGESAGETVGYRTRLDTAISSVTKIEVVTEGILTRILQHDPSLQDYGLVIFDEFHERSLQADLGLALSIQTQSLFREDLRLLIMSATLETQALTHQLPKAPILTCEGTMFPVETRYLASFDSKDLIHHVTKTIQQLVKTESGNLLVFLPGAGEIRRVAQNLLSPSLPTHILIAPLYGHLSPQDQDQAILPPPPGWRKIVLSTNIAETSLTIEGIRIVVDSGLMRMSRFDVRSGMTRLMTMPISQASAEQRRGRAGRLEPGLCVRCWAEPTQRTLATRTPPEILDTDLTPLALELAMWGIQEASDLLWLDAPPSGALMQGRQLLQSLDALDQQGRITTHGQKMADLPLHPRLAHMIIKGMEIQLGVLACDLAAVLSERGLLQGSPAQGQADLRARMEDFYRQNTRDQSSGVLRRIRQASHMWQRALNIPARAGNRTQLIDHIGVLLAFAYPDRIAQRQTDASRRYKLANGRLAQFFHPNPLEQEEYLVIADLDGAQPVSRIYLATPIHREDLCRYFTHLLRVEEYVEWNETAQAVVANKTQRLGELILEERRLHKPDPELIINELLTGIRRKGLSCLPWTHDQRHWQARVEFLRRVMGTEAAWPDVTNDVLFQSLDSWLGPYLTEISSLSQLQRIDLTWPLQALLSPEQRRTLDTLAPPNLLVPTGSRITLDYESGQIPILAVRLQELFGMTETPRLANGQMPVLIHLLSPARRPVQVTQDLTSFWKNGYPEVKKELKGRYPKHFWPDDPLKAPPTRGVKKS